MLLYAISRDNGNRIPRSSSIDSMVETVWSVAPRISLPLASPMQTASYQTQQYLQINYGNTGTISRRESLLSPSAGRREKQQRLIASKCFCVCFILNSTIWWLHLNGDLVALQINYLDGKKWLLPWIFLKKCISERYMLKISLGNR